MSLLYDGGMNPPELSPELPEPIIVPDTAANRALFIAVWKNDAAAVFAAFEQESDPNATARFPNFGLPPPVSDDSQRQESEADPCPLLSLVPPSRHGKRLPQNEEEYHHQAVAIFRQFLERGADLRAMHQRGYNPVCCALNLGDVALLRMVLDRGGDAGALMGSSESDMPGNAVNYALLRTIPSKEEEMVPLLSLILETGADPNLYDCLGKTPLHSAASLGMLQTVKILLQHGAEPALFTLPGEIDNREGMRISHKATPLMLAARNGNTEIIDMLAAVTPNQSAEDAVMAGDVVALQKHFGSGLDPNRKNERGVPFIVLAAASGATRTLKLLLEHEADPDAESPGKVTALYRAAMLGHADAVKVLLDFGANPNATRGRGDRPETALTRAIQSAEVEIVITLLAHPRLDPAAPGNREALLWAVQSAGSVPGPLIGKAPQSVKPGKELWEAQAQIYNMLVVRSDVRVVGGTALCIAVKKGEFGIAEHLLQRGADVNARDREGKTVLMLTVERMGLSLFSRYVVERENRTPENKKAEAENVAPTKFLRLLLSKQPDLGISLPTNADGMGQTALAMARRWKLNKVSALLKQAGAKR